MAQLALVRYFSLLLLALLAAGDNVLIPVLTANCSAFMDREEVRAVHEVMAATGNTWVKQIPDVCKGRWHGIECSLDPSTNKLHVTSLSLGVLSDDTAFPDCTRDATFSPSIAKLTYLRRIFFYKCLNRNPQPIPAEIAKLGATLESLVLRENGHVGGIPVELANLTKLQTLDLHGNNLSSQIPAVLGSLSSLHKLDLSKNRVTGEIPAALGGLVEIKILDLSHNLHHLWATRRTCFSLISATTGSLEAFHHRFPGYPRSKY